MLQLIYIKLWPYYVNQMRWIYFWVVDLFEHGRTFDIRADATEEHGVYHLFQITDRICRIHDIIK